MNGEVQEDIAETLNHFSERVKTSHEARELAEKFRLSRGLDFNDLDSVKRRAQSLIVLTEKRYQAGLLSEQERMSYIYYAVADLIHETKWMNGYYSSDLDPISQKMRAIEKLHGLSNYQYWKKGDAPSEYQLLDKEYEKILDLKLEAEFIEFAPRELSDLFISDKEAFETLSEIGRRSIFLKDDIDRLSELSSIYEAEANKCEGVAAYFSASITLAAAMEARLLVQCLENRETVADVFLRMKRDGEVRGKSANPLDWSLQTLIEVCARSGWLPNVEARDFVLLSQNIAHVVRNARNLVHPGQHVKRRASLSLGREQFKDIKAAYGLVQNLLRAPNESF